MPTVAETSLKFVVTANTWVCGFLALGCGLLASCVPGTTSEQAAQLRFGSGVGEVPGGFGLALPVGAPGDPVAIGAIVVCADRGSATVLGMHFQQNDGLVVKGFSVRTVETDVHAVMAAPKNKTLTGAGWPSRPDAATARCGQEELVTELGVEVALRSGSRGEAEGLVISYESGRRSDKLVVPFELVLCAAPTCSQ
jgi:hypothetical protein